MTSKKAQGVPPTYGGRTVEAWFAAIRAREADSPDAIQAFRTGRLGKKAAGSVPFLITCLDDEQLYGDFNVRYLAAYALGKIGRSATAAIPSLQTLAEAGNRDSHYAVEALGAVDPAACGFPFWSRLLQSNDNMIVRSAAEALGRLKTKAAPVVPDLIVAATANVEFGLPQNFDFCSRALVRIAPDDPEVIRLFVHMAGAADYASGLRCLHDSGSDAAVRALRGLLPRMPDEAEVLEGRYGHRVRTLFEKIEAKDPGFHFVCPVCGANVGRGAARRCCGIDYV